MQKNKIKKYLSISLILAFILPAFTARADLVDDLIKEYKLDPKNNPKHQCDLMYMLLDESIAVGSENTKIYYEPLAVLDYNKQNQRWYYEWEENAHTIIYKKNPYKILGLAIGDVVYGYNYDSYRKSHKGFPKNTYILSDIRFHRQFSKAESQYAENQYKDLQIDFKKGSYLAKYDNNLLLKNASYFKVRGCYIEDFKINKKDKNLYQPKIIN